jgi:DegV family protein with EDD domain
MTIPEYWSALASGAGAVAEWGVLLDRINVYPVADGDTGANLVASFAPLLGRPLGSGELRRELLLCARGNSGNIASQFLAGLLTEPRVDGLHRGMIRGRTLAWSAVPEPLHGTMLSVFDGLVEQLGAADLPLPDAGVAGVVDGLAQVVRRTRGQLPVLAEAGVVDAGALGMFIFLERFLSTVSAGTESRPTVAQRFGELLELQPGVRLASETGFCIDAVVRTGTDGTGSLQQLGSLGSSVVVHAHEGLVKIHLHAEDLQTVQRELARAGEVVRFASDDLSEQTRAFTDRRAAGPIQVVTDAAGSLTADDAARLGVTLLSSYILCDGSSTPESRMVAQELYEAMRRGVRVSTSQASLKERHDTFARLHRSHERLVYITVGSAFSGIHEVAEAWQRREDSAGRMHIIDSGAASGRLGVSVLATAEFARSKGDVDADAVIDFARRAVTSADELVFLDRLKYLAASGRLSKTAAFFGEALRLKPIVTPAPDGARKVGTVRSRRDQLAFAWTRLASLPTVSGGYLVLLQYTDNEIWLRDEVAPEVLDRLPGARVLVRPMSLTSGAHMGPGTWAMAYLGLTADGLPSPPPSVAEA